MKSYIAYLRTATTEGKIDLQQEVIEKWLSNQSDIKVNEYIKDKGISGLKNTSNVSNAIDKIITQNLDGLIIYSLDRLSRSSMSIMLFLRRLYDNKKQLIIINDEAFSVKEVFNSKTFTIRIKKEESQDEINNKINLMRENINQYQLELD